MPCKQGTRKSIDASKRYYEEQKKYDPWRELWASLVKRVYDEDNGYETLSEDERLYYAVSVLSGEVYNGGMHQFFSNSSGELYRDAIEGLQKLGAVHSFGLLQDAVSILFDDEEPPTDRLARWDAMKHYPEGADASIPEWSSRLNFVDKAFWVDPDGLNDRLVAFAKTTGLVEPYLRGGE